MNINTLSYIFNFSGNEISMYFGTDGVGSREIHLYSTSTTVLCSSRLEQARPTQRSRAGGGGSHGQRQRVETGAAERERDP
jgi:hypothetical protein